jgi:hypothetical protein
MKTYWEWIHRDAPIPQADRVMVLIRQAGPQGISRGGIGGQIDLDKETLDDLLAALVNSGQAVLTRERGLDVYRVR